MKKIKLISFIICLLLIFINSSFAQIAFQKTYNFYNSWGYSVQQTSDGGYIMTGSTQNLNTSYIDLIKTNANGDTLWTRNYGYGSAYGSNVGYSVQQTNDGGYVIAGTIVDSITGRDHVYLIKTNSNGDTIWTKCYGSTGNDYGYSVKQTLDSGFIIAGATDSIGAGGYDVFLIKTNSIGDTLWTKTYGGDSSDYAEAVELTTDGGYIIAGYTNSFGAGGYDVYLIKTDSIGEVLWSKCYGSTDSDYGYSVKQTSDGGFIIGGNTLGRDYLIKTNSIGDTLWTKTFDNYGERNNSVQQTIDGGYIIVGTYVNWMTSAMSNILLIKTNSIGEILWAKIYLHGGTDSGNGYSVQQTTDGGYIIAGDEEGLMLLIKTDANGNYDCYHYDFAIYIDSVQTQVSNTSTIIKSGCMVSNPSKAVGNGGAMVTTHCFTSGINEIIVSNYLTIYPNPANDYFTIYIDKESYNSNLEIRNVLGEKIYIEKFVGKQVIVSCNELSAGIYFIEIRTEKEVITKKLIISK